MWILQALGALAALWLLAGGINLVVLAWASKHAPKATEVLYVGLVRLDE